jgi:hypothetical protein
MKLSFATFRVPKTNITRAKQSSSWRDPRLWLGIVLVVASITSANWYVNRIGQRTFVVVAAHSLARGTAIAATDLRLVPMAIPSDVNVVTNADKVIGEVVARDVATNEIFTSETVAGIDSRATRVLSIPIRAGRLPHLEHGQTVDVWVTPSSESGNLPGPSELIVASAVVVAAPDALDAVSDSAVSLAVSDVAVGAVLAAMRDGVVDVVAVGQMAQ